MKYSNGYWHEEGYEIKVSAPFVHRDGEEYVIDVYSPNGEEAGFFRIEKLANHPAHGEILHVMEVEVMTKHRRKGIATAVYTLMEEMTGVKIHNEPDQQSPEAKELWHSPKRTFGKW